MLFIWNSHMYPRILCFYLLNLATPPLTAEEVEKKKASFWNHCLSHLKNAVTWVIKSLFIYCIRSAKTEVSKVKRLVSLTAPQIQLSGWLLTSATSWKCPLPKYPPCSCWPTRVHRCTYVIFMCYVFSWHFLLFWRKSLKKNYWGQGHVYLKF